MKGREEPNEYQIKQNSEETKGRNKRKWRLERVRGTQQLQKVNRKKKAK